MSRLHAGVVVITTIFGEIFSEKLAFFFKNPSCIREKTPIFSSYFLAKIFKILTSVPAFAQVFQMARNSDHCIRQSSWC
jgi:hypothetical protein